MVEDVCVINVDGLFIIHNRKVTVKIQLFLFESGHSLMWHIVFHYILLQKNFKEILTCIMNFVFLYFVCVSVNRSVADGDS